MKNRNRRYPPKVWDERGRIWRIGSISNSIFPTRPRFLRLVYDHSQRIKTQIYTVREVSVRRWWIPLITNPLNCWAPVPLSQINAVSLSRQIRNRGNLGQTSGEYPIYQQNLGWSAKSKIPDHLGFTWHMATKPASYHVPEPRVSYLLPRLINAFSHYLAISNYFTDFNRVYMTCKYNKKGNHEDEYENVQCRHKPWVPTLNPFVVFPAGWCRLELKQWWCQCHSTRVGR